MIQYVASPASMGVWPPSWNIFGKRSTSMTVISAPSPLHTPIRPVALPRLSSLT